MIRLLAALVLVGGLCGFVFYSTSSGPPSAVSTCQTTLVDSLAVTTVLLSPAGATSKLISKVSGC